MHDGGLVRYESGPGRSFLLVLVGAVLGGLVALSVAPQVLPGWPPASGAWGEVAQLPRTPVPAPDLERTSAAIVRVVEQVGPSVVGIVNRQRVTDIWTGRSVLVDQGYGSGVVFDAQGHVVTNAHVVAGADALEVVLADGRRVPAELVAHDAPYSDVAVVRVRAPGLRLPPARFGDSDAVRVGEIVIAIGNPKGLEFFRSVTMGVVSGIRSDLFQRLAEQGGPYRDARIFKVIQTDAAINSGNSGGPLVNLRGEVVGITTLKLVGEGTEGMGFAIPSNDVRAIARDLIRQGYVSRPALGVSVAREDVARSQFGVERGVLVVDVTPGGPAQRAGIRPGDVILRLGTAEIGTFLDLVKALSRYRPGDRVSVTVQRDGRVLTVEVQLGELGR